MLYKIPIIIYHVLLKTPYLTSSQLVKQGFFSAAFIVLLNTIKIPYASLLIPFLHSIFDIPWGRGITAEITALQDFFFILSELRVFSCSNTDIRCFCFCHFESHNPPFALWGTEERCNWHMIDKSAIKNLKYSN